MTTKTFDSTVSQNLQDNSLFNFDAEHNGEACIESLKPEDAHTPNAFRFTIAMLCTIYAVPKQTMHDNIDSLLEDEEIAQSDISYYAIPGGNNRTYETALYNLNVLNRLGMCCFRKNKEAKKVRDKFNDVLVERETQTQSVQPTIYDYARALIAEKERSDALEAQNKALTAERDEAIRTKYHFVEGRDAKVCGELGGLRTQNEALRKQIGDSKTYKAATAIAWLPDYFDMSNRGLYNALAHKLKKVEAGMPPAFAHIDIQDSRWGSVKAYHVSVIERLHEMIQADESLMKNYRKIASV